MLQYEFAVLLMMTSLLLVKGLRIAVLCQDFNVEGLEAYAWPNNRIDELLPFTSEFIKSLKRDE